MKTVSRRLGVPMLAASLVVAPLALPGSVLAADSSDPIKFILNDWTGQLISARIMGDALKRQGYNIEYVQTDAMAEFVGLKSGDLHVAMEVWSTTQAELFEEAVASGRVEDMGDSGMEAREEWWYPSYVKELCPGLPNWEALLEPDCVAALTTPETVPKARYLGAPVTWGGYDEERVEALGLDFEVIHAGTDAALFAELASAYQRQAPIILWVYSPHWVPAVYDGEYVEFPPYTPDCYEEERYDCGKPMGPIWKAAWTGLAEKWPAAHGAIQSFSISSEESNELIRRVDVEKEQLDAVVGAWLDENEARWKAWFE